MATPPAYSSSYELRPFSVSPPREGLRRRTEWRRVRKESHKRDDGLTPIVDTPEPSLSDSALLDSHHSQRRGGGGSGGGRGVLSDGDFEDDDSGFVCLCVERAQGGWGWEGLGGQSCAWKGGMEGESWRWRWGKCDQDR